MGGFKFESHKNEAIDETKENIERALIAVGIQAEGYAVEIARAKGVYDTGRLIGSITYATNTKHSTGREPAEPDDYKQMAEAEEGGVYVGTNVEYAPYQELGTHKQKPRPFLRPAMENHISEYAQIFEEYIKNSKFSV